MDGWNGRGQYVWTPKETKGLKSMNLLFVTHNLASLGALRAQIPTVRAGPIQERSAVCQAADWDNRSHMETLIIYKLGSMKFTTQNDLD